MLSARRHGNLRTKENRDNGMNMLFESDPGNPRILLYRNRKLSSINPLASHCSKWSEISTFSLQPPFSSACSIRFWGRTTTSHLSRCRNAMDGPQERQRSLRHFVGLAMLPVPSRLVRSGCFLARHCFISKLLRHFEGTGLPGC